MNLKDPIYRYKCAEMHMVASAENFFFDSLNATRDRSFRNSRDIAHDIDAKRVVSG